MVSGDAFRVLVARSVLYRHLKTKHEECKVRAKLREMGRESINVARWGLRALQQYAGTVYGTTRRGFCCLIVERENS